MSIPPVTRYKAGLGHIGLLAAAVDPNDFDVNSKADDDCAIFHCPCARARTVALRFPPHDYTVEADGTVTIEGSIGGSAHSPEARYPCHYWIEQGRVVPCPDHGCGLRT